MGSIYVARHDGMIQSDLANILELGQAALGSLIDRLEASGLVRRRADQIGSSCQPSACTSAGLIKDLQVHKP